MEMKKNLNFESDEELILVQPSEKYMPELSAYKKIFWIMGIQWMDVDH